MCSASSSASLCSDSRSAAVSDGGSLQRSQTVPSREMVIPLSLARRFSETLPATPLGTASGGWEAVGKQAEEEAAAPVTPPQTTSSLVDARAGGTRSTMAVTTDRMNAAFEKAQQKKFETVKRLSVLRCAARGGWWWHAVGGGGTRWWWWRAVGAGGD